MPVTTELARMSDTVRHGLGSVADARRRRDEDARLVKEREAATKRQDEFDAYRRPGLKLQARTAQTELDRLGRPADFVEMFGEPDAETGEKRLPARRLEQAMFYRDPKPGEPERKQILKRPLYEVVGNLFGAKFATEGPHAGFLVKKNGTPVTIGEMESRRAEIEALFVARTGQNRLLREMGEQAFTKYKETGDLKAYQAAMLKKAKLENSPEILIQNLQAKKNYLRRFPSKESTAAIERADDSIQKILNKLQQKDPEKWQALSGGLGLFEVGSGRTRLFPEGVRNRGKKELSPSQQIKAIELENINKIIDPASTPDQRKSAAVSLETIRGKSRLAQAVSMVFKNPETFYATGPEIEKMIDTALRSLTEAPARLQEPQPQQAPPTTPDEVKARYQAGEYGTGPEAKATAESLIDALTGNAGE